MTTADDKFIACPAGAGFVAEGFLAPWGARVFAHTMPAAITTAVWVIGSVHDNAADGGANALVPCAAGFADLDVLMLFIADGTKTSGAIHMYHADLAAGEFDLSIRAFFGSQLGAGAGGADDLGAAARLQFDGVNDATNGDVFERQAIAGFNRHFFAAADLLADLHALGG